MQRSCTPARPRGLLADAPRPLRQRARRRFSLTPTQPNLKVCGMPLYQSVAERILERARGQVKKLLNDPRSCALENLQSIPGWQSIDLAKVVAEVVEERVANGGSEDEALELVAGPTGALEFWLEGNDGTFNSIRRWMDEFCQEYDCPGILERGGYGLDCELPRGRVLN